MGMLTATQDSPGNEGPRAPGVRVRVRVRARGGDVFPQADPECINTQQMHTNHIISGL